MALQRSNASGFADRLKDEVQNSTVTLEDMLSPLCTGTREEFTNGSIMITDIEMISGTTGEMYFYFEGYAHLGCRDASGPIEHEEHVPFVLSTDGVLTFTIKYLEEREPDEI